MIKISVGIPYFNRINFIEETLNTILDDDRISEIVINDDYSEKNDFSQLISKFGNNEKIKIYRNEKNLGSFLNKLETVKNCTMDWVILLDSDNYLFPSYIDSIFSLENLNKKSCYFPDGMLANGNWEPFGRCNGHWDHGRFGYEPIGFNQIKDIYAKDYGIMGLLNAGNCFFFKDEYIQVCEKINESEYEFFTKSYGWDAVAFMYLWMSTGNYLQVLKNAEYFHRMHVGSHWATTNHLVSNFELIIKNKFNI